MYQAPEVKHLQDAVKHVKEALIPAVTKEPTPDKETEQEREVESEDQERE